MAAAVYSWSQTAPWCRVIISRLISSSFSHCNHREEMKGGKGRVKRKVVSFRPVVLLIFAVPLNLSLFTAGWSKLNWRLPSASNVLKLAVIFSAEWNYFFPPFFCLLALAIPFRMTQFLKCALCLSWQVTSVWRNNLQSTVTTPSTANKERGHFSHLVPGLTKWSRQVQAWNHVWRNIFYAWKKKNLVVLQRRHCEATAALCDSGLRLWGLLFAEREAGQASRIVSGHPTWCCRIIISLLPFYILFHFYL